MSSKASTVTVGSMLRRIAVVMAVLVAPIAANQAYAQDPDNVVRTELSLRESFAGSLQFVSTGGTLRTQANDNESGVANSACVVNQNGLDTRTISGVPPGSTIEAAFLFWAGSRNDLGNTGVPITPPDWNVTFEGVPVTAPLNRRYLNQHNVEDSGSIIEHFGTSVNVTNIVRSRPNPNGTYQFRDLSVYTGEPQCALESVLASWALFIVYSNPNEANRVINLFDGLQSFRGDSVIIQTGNFRTPPATGPRPESRLAVLTYDGDPGNSATFNGNSESFRFNSTSPTTGNNLTNAQNPANNQFNHTVSGPGTPLPANTQVYGTDLDVYNVAPFLAAGGGQTSFPLRYASGGDFVILTMQMSAIENVAATDLRLLKDSNDTDLAIGETGSWDINVRNQGPDSVVDTITVVDTLPANTTFAGFSGGSWNCSASGQTVTCTHPPLPSPNVNADYPTLTISMLANAAPANNSPFYSNTATVSLPANAATFDNVAGNNTDDAVTPFDGGGGGSLCYLADDNDDELYVVDTANANAGTNETLVGSYAGGAPNDDVESIAWNYAQGVLYAADESVLGTINVSNGAFTQIGTGFGTADEGTLGNVTLNDIDAMAFDARSNTLYGIHRRGGGNDGQNDVLVQINPITGAHIDKAFGGADYIEVQALGTLDRHDGAAVDPNTGIFYITGSTGIATPSSLLQLNPVTGATTLVGSIGFNQVQGLGFDASGQLFGSVGDGTGEVIQINTTTGAGTNAIPVDGNGGGTVAVNYEAIDCPASFPILGADLEVSKTVDDDTPAAGDTITYTIAVINNGPGVANAVDVFDQLPAGVTFVSATPSVGTFVEADATWYVGTLGAGGLATLDIVATVDAGTDGQIITNTATIAASSQPDPNNGNDEDSQAIQVGFPSLTVVKTSTVFSDPVNGTTNPKRIPGSFIDYTIGVTNTGAGAADADTVLITDPPLTSPGFPDTISLFVGDLDAGSPVEYTDGGPSGTTTGMTYQFINLGSGADDIAFSNNGGLNFNYTPVPDAQGFDPNVTHVQINPQGAFPAGPPGQPSIQFRLRVRVD